MTLEEASREEMIRRAYAETIVRVRWVYRWMGILAAWAAVDVALLALAVLVWLARA